MYQFKEEKFLSISEKERILKAWIQFIANGLNRNHFTKALYTHIHIHCGFLAHYDIHGFYSEYFTTGEGKIRFLEQFDRKFIARNWWCSHKTTGDYSDLTNAMIDELEKFLPVLYAGAKAEQKTADLNVVDFLLKKHGLSLDEYRTPKFSAKEPEQISLFN